MAKKISETDQNAPRKFGALKLALGAVALLAAGAGTAYGAFAAGLIGEGVGPGVPDVPTLVLKGQHDPYAPADASEDGGAVYGEGGSKYRRAYYSFGESFTSNLSDSPGLVQVSLAASTHHDGRVLQWLEQHELAIRSAILVELAATPEDDVYSPKGKERLQQRLVDTINAVLVETEGFGGVEAVHFEAFLVQ